MISTCPTFDNTQFENIQDNFVVFITPYETKRIKMFELLLIKYTLYFMTINSSLFNLIFKHYS